MNGSRFFGFAESKLVGRRWPLPVAATLAVFIGSVCGVAIPCRAEPVPMAPQDSHRTTFDGWNLSLSLSGEVINAVPNLAGSQNSREAFMTLSAQANIDGAGSNPVTAGNFIAGYQIGCQTDVSQGLQVGGIGQLAGSVGANLSAQPGVQAAGSGMLGGYVQTDLQPGVITTIPMGNMPLVTHVGRLDMQDVHLKVDSCGGAVTVRSYASMAVATAVEETQLSVYGDPYVLN